MPAPGPASASPQPIDRLSTFDLMFLRLEDADQPCHFGGLAVLDGAPLRQTDGALRLAEILTHLAGRTAQVPRLRQRVHRPGWLRGRPVWVDDAAFDIREPCPHQARRLTRGP